MKKIILAISLALAAMTMSSCIVLRDIPDSDYSYTETEKKAKPNRPGSSSTNSTTSKNTTSKNTTKKAKPNRP